MHNNEWQQPGRTLVMILGACTTVKRNLSAPHAERVNGTCSSPSSRRKTFSRVHADSMTAKEVCGFVSQALQRSNRMDCSFMKGGLTCQVSTKNI